MSAPSLFQLAPTAAFTPAQIRQLNAIFLRLSQSTANILFGGIGQRPDPGVPNRIFIQTDSGGPHLYLDVGTTWYTVV